MSIKVTYRMQLMEPFKIMPNFVQDCDGGYKTFPIEVLSMGHDNAQSPDFISEGFEKLYRRMLDQRYSPDFKLSIVTITTNGIELNYVTSDTFLNSGTLETRNNPVRFNFRERTYFTFVIQRGLHLPPDNYRVDAVPQGDKVGNADRCYYPVVTCWRGKERSMWYFEDDGYVRVEIQGG